MRIWWFSNLQVYVMIVYTKKNHFLRSNLHALKKLRLLRVTSSHDAFFPSKKKKTKIRQGSHLELTIADINSSTITSIFTYSEAERATGQVNELHSSPCWREDGSTSFCRKLQDTKKQKKTKLLVELWKHMTPLEDYDIQLWDGHSWPIHPVELNLRQVKDSNIL